ncbi:alpha/beta fold hydrolase [Aeromicrobium ginsengisoli]|uniref:Alpha/beta hydrolase n=1 Tax=Aeromicrobium ginsengisoli TaxID=363867 RepID=A0A5M4FA74_9ACTN|nr:alpha/beta hydrolase [Aeromicrobium ginsengisoli]KAA1395244.1 alpha/beta hydrolase [Aeromicrobium ginsengisoli]
MTYDETTPVQVGDLTFDVRMTGPADGEPVILLHGFPESSLSWSGVAPLLAGAGLRVIAPDQRGYSPGARPSGVESYTTDLLADDVVGIADALGIGSFHLVGHDWGAAVAWVTAVRHRDRLRTLTAVSVPHLAAYGAALQGDPDQQQRASYIGLLRQPGKAEHVLLEDEAQRLRAMYGGPVRPAQVDSYVALLSEPDALTAALNWYRAMRADLGSLPAVTVPTTYVWSDEDQAIGRAGAERCGEFVDADFRFVELAATSHWIPEQDPEALAEAILARVG